MSFAGCLLGVLVLYTAARPHPALAQHADAGVGHKAAAPPAQTPAPPAAPEAEPSGVLPKAINPAQLSEGVRARLAEQAAGRHASGISAREPAPRQEPSAQDDRALGDNVGPAFRPRIDSESLRRGEARMRRMQAVETAEGVTLLSNRVHQLPEPRLASMVARRPAPPKPEAPTMEALAAEERAALEESNATETHSLRPLSSRSVKPDGTGLGWLLWPFVLFVTAGAVVGTLWFRKKTE